MVSGGEYILLDKQYRHEDKRIFYCSDLRRGSGHSPCLPVGRCGGIRGDASTMWTIIPGIRLAPDNELVGCPANFLPDIGYPAGYPAE